ncbi:hypothetical protein Riv7116_2991 [Rivularia sp. PCC 7116]|uniref:hypothetical protein n=1 Tax=Rivularia sp. PCC 7116 TaxID=373994 RepID=UPI00029F0909|nr:hypothetical protein [Rivularia sp. PCC 7116]AFY55472.1 hypothetical protein Riv7116_2991 [Rivularia sp. PCC 7116]
MKLFALSSLFLLLFPLAAQADMVVTTKSGRQYTIPVNGDDVQSIRFTDSGSNGQQSGSSWRGRWKTSEGNMNLRQNGNVVSGTYTQDKGRISGQVSGNTLNGIWAENSSARKCKVKKLNTFYWGRISFTQQAGGQKFIGKWGYCNEKPDANWTGTR